MKILLYLFCSLFSLTLYAQTKENQNSILFNASSDTIVTLNTLVDSFEIQTHFNGQYKIQVYHIRTNRLISSIMSDSTHFKSSYITDFSTNDIFLVQLLSTHSDSILLYKRFHIVNAYMDNIEKLAIDSINRCNETIQSPYKFEFNIYVNDRKIDNYEVAFFRTSKTTATSEYSSLTIYSDSIPTQRNGNFFYISEKIDSIAMVIRIGKSGQFIYEVMNANFQYGGSVYFAVSTNDKKLYDTYKTAKNYSELPYLAIAKNYKNRNSYGKKHSVLYINCNEKCNYSTINYKVQYQRYKMKDLK